MGNAIGTVSPSSASASSSSASSLADAERDYSDKVTHTGGGGLGDGTGVLQHPYAVSSCQGRRPTQEDRHVILQGWSCGNSCGGRRQERRRQNNLWQKNVWLPDHSLYAVLDGHGGEMAAEFAQSTLAGIWSTRPSVCQYAVMNEEERANVPGLALLQEGLRETLHKVDAELFKAVQKRKEEVKLQQQRQRQRRAQDRLANHQSNDVDYFNSNNEYFEQQELQHEERSGSTALVVIVTPTHIVTANVGDSRAILVRKLHESNTTLSSAVEQQGSTAVQAIPLSIDHKPHSLRERMRIQGCGGVVTSNRRVNGDLAVSRALGDFVYKKQHAAVMTCDPEILVTRRRRRRLQDECNSGNMWNPHQQQQQPQQDDADEDLFLVLACDGVWDVAGSQQLATFLYEMMEMQDNDNVDWGKLCEETLQTCLERESRDNMTMILVGLQQQDHDDDEQGGNAAEHMANMEILQCAQSSCRTDDDNLPAGCASCFVDTWRPSAIRLNALRGV